MHRLEPLVEQAAVHQLVEDRVFDAHRLAIDLDLEAGRRIAHVDHQIERHSGIGHPLHVGLEIVGIIGDVVEAAVGVTVKEFIVGGNAADVGRDDFHTGVARIDKGDLRSERFLLPAIVAHAADFVEDEEGADAGGGELGEGLVEIGIDEAVVGGVAEDAAHGFSPRVVGLAVLLPRGGGLVEAEGDLVHAEAQRAQRGRALAEGPSPIERRVFGGVAEELSPAAQSGTFAAFAPLREIPAAVFCACFGVYAPVTVTPAIASPPPRPPTRSERTLPSMS